LWTSRVWCMLAFERAITGLAVLPVLSLGVSELAFRAVRV